MIFQSGGETVPRVPVAKRHFSSLLPASRQRCRSCFHTEHYETFWNITWSWSASPVSPHGWGFQVGLCKTGWTGWSNRPRHNWESQQGMRDEKKVLLITVGIYIFVFALPSLWVEWWVTTWLWLLTSWSMITSQWMRLHSTMATPLSQMIMGQVKYLSLPPMEMPCRQPAQSMSSGHERS